jgi:5S rRNA maturation endonuclease (ribonuclease M5)
MTRRHSTHNELNNLLDRIEQGLSADEKQLKQLFVKNKADLNGFKYFYGHDFSALTKGLKPLVMNDWKAWRRTSIGMAVDLTDKVTAASTGHSHDVSNKQGMIAYWPQKEPQPALAYFNGVEWQIPYPPSRDLLLLENEALFLMRNETQSALDNFFSKSIQNIDWAFSAGNAISKKTNIGFLNQYRNIYVLTDIDLGGLKIFLNLESLMKDTSAVLIQLFPNNTGEWLKNHGHSFTRVYRNSIKKILPSLSGSSLAAANKILETSLIMEQEALLRKCND